MANQTVTLEQGQCLVDIAVQHCGDADMLIELALLNGLDIDDVAEGGDLVLPPLSIEGSEIANYLAEKNIVPASALVIIAAANNATSGLTLVVSFYNNKVVLEQGQCVLDIAVQHCGDADKLIELAILNGLDIDDVAEGSDFLLPPLSIEGLEIASYLAVKQIVPASALTGEQMLLGLDEWTLYYTVGLPANHG